MPLRQQDERLPRLPLDRREFPVRFKYDTLPTTSGLERRWQFWRFARWTFEVRFWKSR
jgi:hypothetical protein